jgi:hypothetical protein
VEAKVEAELKVEVEFKVEEEELHVKKHKKNKKIIKFNAG